MKSSIIFFQQQFDFLYLIIVNHLHFHADHSTFTKIKNVEKIKENIKN